jgi:hypothetical protein
MSPGGRGQHTTLNLLRVGHHKDPYMVSAKEWTLEKHVEILGGIMPFAPPFPKERELFGNPTDQHKGIRKYNN